MPWNSSRAAAIPPASHNGGNEHFSISRTAPAAESFRISLACPCRMKKMRLSSTPPGAANASPHARASRKDKTNRFAGAR